ncbi:DUF4153 domain-containing protein [Massilia sp. SR12]
MEATPHETVRNAAVTQRVGQLRLIVGLAQGGLLYLLYHAQQAGAWPATRSGVFFPLVLAAIVLPVLLISSLGHLRRRALAWWLGGAAVVLAVVGLHDAWRSALDPAPLKHPSFLVLPFCLGFFFIAHSLVLAVAHDGRRRVRYATCFDSAWKLAIQLLFSAMFVLAVWLVMWLGDSLFDLLKLNFVEELLRQSWFSVPLVCLAFSSAMHTTDVRPAIVRGVRSLLLVLMAWIVPIAVLLIGAFLAALPFTGLQVLWQTRHATAVLMAACAVLVVLVNAAFQAGDAGARLAGGVRIAARIACLLLLPLALLGVYALGLRVGDYGWTTDRVIAAACLAAALFYAGGYGWAAVRRGATWLEGLRYVNLAAAFVVLALALALFTPVADPARIAVSDQMARLARGAIPAERFDYGFLRFHGARYGAQALQALAAQGAGPQAAVVRRHAAATLSLKYEDPHGRPAAVDVGANLRVWPQGSRLPDSWLRQDWRAYQARPLPGCLRHAASRCDAFLMDADGDGKDEVLLVGETARDGEGLLAERDGAWQVVARTPLNTQLAGCKAWQERLRAGDFTLAAPRLREIEVGGKRIAFTPVAPRSLDCSP